MKTISALPSLLPLCNPANNHIPVRIAGFCEPENLALDKTVSKAALSLSVPAAWVSKIRRVTIFVLFPSLAKGAIMR